MEEHPDLKRSVLEGWNKSPQGDSVENLRQKLQQLSDGLCSWDKVTFGNVQGEIRKLKLELEILRRLPGRLGPSSRELKITEVLIELYHREEILWRQRSRIQWLVGGDKNTKFFHLRATMRRRKNLIKSLQNDNGDIVSNIDELDDMATLFYSNHFSSEGVNNMDKVVNGIPTKVSNDMNVSLTTPYTS